MKPVLEARNTTLHYLFLDPQIPYEILGNETPTLPAESSACSETITQPLDLDEPSRACRTRSRGRFVPPYTAGRYLVMSFLRPVSNERATPAVIITTTRRLNQQGGRISPEKYTRVVVVVPVVVISINRLV